MDNLANALVNIKNCEEMGKKECVIKPASKLIGSVLKIMQRENYVGNFEFIEDGRSGMYRVQLKGAVNNCKAIKPRYSAQKNEFPKWEKRYLPSKTLGTLIVSTPNGVISHREAKMAGVGGKLIAFVY
ncbi:30S ribosomal protein S8 [Candidatus Micrarchaeota archaeon]|nr:30S ribosomal protein S8 [Candidatus Micrarchaeota archaeon]